MSVQPEDPETPSSSAARVEAALIALIVLLAGSLALPELVAAVRDGEVNLATIFYPVTAVAIATLAWTRRAGR